MTAAPPVSFLTGATGFVGAALARLLESKGHHLRLLCRKGNDRRNLEGLKNIEIIEGDLCDPATYATALTGCDNLFHVAADYRIWVPDEAAMNRVNIDGTESLMIAAHEAGIGKIVYTSSVATLGIPKDGSQGTEDTPVALSDMIGIYKRSKFLAEELVHRLIRETGLHAIIVNPSTPIGPRDIKPTPTGRIIVEAAAGRMPVYVDTGLNIAHVDDVAMGHWLALEKGKIGERYILGGEDMDFGTLLKEISDITGTPPPYFKIPRAPLFPLAYIAEAMARLTKIEPFITADGLRMSKKKMFFSSDKAKNELGYAPRPAKQALQDAIIWFKDQGYF
ncbi:MAG TPA: NAD-dependent dehydratase [Rhodospirillaceae bacterium]|nr:NAD-dependent dehydratase [Rhodospirillaceae bacterium]